MFAIVPGNCCDVINTTDTEITIINTQNTSTIFEDLKYLISSYKPGEYKLVKLKLPFDTMQKDEKAVEAHLESVVGLFLQREEPIILALDTILKFTV